MAPRVNITGLRLGSLGRAAVIAGFALLVCAGLGAVIMTRIAAEAENLAAHSLAVRHGGTLMLSSVQDAEQGQRGYLLTGDPSFLAPYETALTELPPLQAKLRELVLDNPDQLVRLGALNGDIACLSD